MVLKERLLQNCQILIVFTQTLFFLVEIAPLAECRMHARVPEAIDAAMLRDYIIPDVLSFNSPNDSIWIQYENKEVNFGELFSPAEVDFEPTYINYPCSENVYYTLILTGLDMPTRKNHTEREYQHWVVGNIPENIVKKGETLTEYIGPMYTAEDGPHRFVFFVFAQPDKMMIKFTEKRLTKMVHGKERVHFKTMKFAEKYKLGEPLCVNYFLMDRTMPTEPPTEPML